MKKLTTLEEILQTLGAEIPFAESGELTPAGADSYDVLRKICEGLHYIGAIKETPDEVESICDEIVRHGF